MAFDAALQRLRNHFQIQSPQDWTRVRAHDVRALDGIGDATLNHLRLHLAARGLTLENDGTPEQWQTFLSKSAVGSKADFRSKVAPFQIAIDVQEKIPFQFSGIMADSQDGNRYPIQVGTVVKSLGPTHGDYSIVGMEEFISVERKSKEDAISTFLSQGERRERWQATMDYLTDTPHACVVVECSIGQMLAAVKSRGARPVEVLVRTLHRQILAWQDDYRFPWIFCDDRRLAEISTFHFLRRAWRNMVELAKSDRSETDVDVIHNSI
jgi:hypothetical protein